MNKSDLQPGMLLEDVKKKIKLTPEQQADYDAGKPVTITKPTIKWEPKGGEWFISIFGLVDKSTSSLKHCAAGLEYPTKKQAKQAAKKMRSHNRLLAWLSEHDDGFVEKWDYNQPNWYLRCDTDNGKWCIGWTNAHKVLGTAYMSRTNAELLAKKLNEGTVEL